MSGVPPAEGDLPLRKRDQTMVGDGNAMGVAAQILEHIFGATEGTVRVDHPIYSEEGPEPSSEGFGLGGGCQISTKAKSADAARPREPQHELAPQGTSN